LRHGSCPATRVGEKQFSIQQLGRGTTAALTGYMSRTSSKSSVPPTSRITRRTETAQRELRVINGGRATGTPHGEFATQCLPHQQELYAVAMRICRDPDTAKDLVQETLLRAMVAWHSFEPGSNLRAWLFRILTNAFINGYRKRRRHQRFAVERPGDALHALYGTDQDHTVDLEDELYRDQLGDEVQGALGKLASDYREVVERADLRGQKYKDIADDLGMPIGTVMSRLFRARRVLEIELADYAKRDYGIKRAA
jgi:RNA polymerase sigma-70 factor (ECF subfamily)